MFATALADVSGVHTTVRIPIFHRPKDECGGGSAWFTGLLDCFYQRGWSEAAASSTPTADITGSTMVESLRRADLLAAMCQETVGDHSQVTRSQLSHVEQTHQVRRCNALQLPACTKPMQSQCKARHVITDTTVHSCAHACSVDIRKHVHTRTHARTTICAQVHTRARHAHYASMCVGDRSGLNVCPSQGVEVILDEAPAEATEMVQPMLLRSLSLGCVGDYRRVVPCACLHRSVSASFRQQLACTFLQTWFIWCALTVTVHVYCMQCECTGTNPPDACHAQDERYPGDHPCQELRCCHQPGVRAHRAGLPVH